MKFSSTGMSLLGVDSSSAKLISKLEAGGENAGNVSIMCVRL